jgi:hypothetical protein
MNGLWSFDEPQPQSPRSWQRWIWWTRGLVDFTAEVSEESPLSPVLAVIGSRRRTTMFAKISLALTMLLGSAWAALAQNYVSQMTPRIRYCDFGAHRIQCCQPVRRAKCRAGRAVSNIYEGQCRCGWQRLTRLEQSCASKTCGGWAKEGIDVEGTCAEAHVGRRDDYAG